VAERAQPLQARDKLAFLLALVPWLMDHDGASVAETAEHFGMTPEQIRDAVSLIAVSGVPGETDSYQHEDLFDIDWDAFEERDEIQLTHHVAIDDAPRFSAREAAALIAGLQYLASLPENAGSATLAGLTGKLSAGASATPSAVGVEADPALASTLALIREAMEGGTQLDLVYLNASGEKERRHVDALRVESFDDDWYLRGWCHLRGAVRTFRLDRISDARVTDEPTEHRADEVRLPDRLFEPSSKDLEVTVDIAPSAVPLIADFIPDGATTTEHDGRVRTTLRVSHYHGLKRLVTRMSGVMTVVGPESAREAVAGWARAGVQRYRSVSG
jgi:proteasome accessory factor C